MAIPERDAVIVRENIVAIIVTGSNRDFIEMEQALNNTGIRNFGMARPFISEPDLVHRYEHEHAGRVTCVSCNVCIDPEKMDPLKGFT